LTGPNADLGGDLWNAAVLALFDSGQSDVVLIPHDTRGTPEGATAAAEAAGRDGATGVVGPLFSSSVTAARPILAASGIRGIALSNNRAVAGTPFYLIGTHPETQIDALASYLDGAGRKRIVLFGPDTPYVQLLRERLTALDRDGKISLAGSRLYRTTASYTEIAGEVRSVTLDDRRAAALKEFTAFFAAAWREREDPEEAMQAALNRLSAKVERARTYQASFSSSVASGRKNWTLSEADYDAARSDLLALYQKQLRAKRLPQEAMTEAIAEFQRRETLGKADFDAVLLPIADKPLLVIAPMFEYFNASQPDVWLLGTDIWESAAQQLPKDLEGGRYVTPTSRQWESFKSRFTAAFGNAPHFLAAASYDAVRVAIAEKQESGHSAFEESFLTRQTGFEGVNGRFRFLPGGVNERTLQIVELRKSGLVDVFTWQPDWQITEPLPAGRETIAPAEPAAPPVQPATPVSTIDISRTGKG
jgi:ABC-type branched-subunit amino acid transport system substrate-binding protein